MYFDVIYCRFINKSQYLKAVITVLKLVKHSELNSGTQNKAFSLQFIILLVETLEKIHSLAFV